MQDDQDKYYINFLTLLTHCAIRMEILKPMKQGTLILEDGTTYQGVSFGKEKSISGEVVFNTGMVGYVESLTDPSYTGQILSLTYPLIGNYGVPGEKTYMGLPQHFESERIHISALIVSEYSQSHNHWQAERSLADWLQEENIPALGGIDTRALTKKLREEGTMLGKIVFQDDVELYDPNLHNLVEQVSITEPRTFNEQGNKRIVLIDCGTKLNIVRSLIQRDCCVIRIPWDYDLLSLDHDGVVISNGPGDPKMCRSTIENIKKNLDREIPTLGICLGNQLLALAAGADTYKLKYGHRSQNQPCQLIGTKKCYITSQNHGFAVDPETLPEDWIPWFRNINDNTNEGIRHKTKPFMSVQFHPEHTPGPVDTEFLFDEFIGKIKS